jgi:hypothetical protein
VKLLECTKLPFSPQLCFATLLLQWNGKNTTIDQDKRVSHVTLADVAEDAMPNPTKGRGSAQNFTTRAIP